MKKIVKKLVLFVLILISIQCEKSGDFERKNISEILYVLCNDIITYDIKIKSLPQPKPPLPYLNYSLKTKEINLEKKIDTIKLIDEFIKKNGRLIVAINPTLNPPYTDNIKIDYLQNNLNSDYNEVYSLFTKIKDSLNLDVSLIPNNKYSYIIPYKTDYVSFARKGYEKFDILLNFSRISFNKEKNKAIVIVGVSFGKLNGFSSIFFLEKKTNKWFINKEIGLSIS